MARLLGTVSSSVQKSFGSFESIASTTLGSNTTSITFSSIPQTYAALQLRIIARSTTSATTGATYLQVNGDSNAAVYTYHDLYGNGTGAYANGSGTGSYNFGPYFYFPAASASTDIFGVMIVDIHDYASTSKRKTIRFFRGEDRNGAGEVVLGSSLWTSTSAITQLVFTADAGNQLATKTTAALYGIKGA